jgi:hypothetical protein
MTSTIQTFLNKWGLYCFPFCTASACVPFFVVLDHFHHFTLASIAPKVILHHELVVGVFFFFSDALVLLYPILHELSIWIPILCVYAFGELFIFFIIAIVKYRFDDFGGIAVISVDLKNQPFGVYQICIEI